MTIRSLPGRDASIERDYLIDCLDALRFGLPDIHKFRVIKQSVAEQNTLSVSAFALYFCCRALGGVTAHRQTAEAKYAREMG